MLAGRLWMYTCIFIVAPRTRYDAETRRNVIKIEGTEILGLRRRSTIKDSRLDISALSGTSLQRLRVNESMQIGGETGCTDNDQSGTAVLP